MSDNQSQTDSYAGLDPAAPAGAAPAFGDVPPPGGDPAGGDSASFMPQVTRPPCSNPECGNALEHPAETDWQQLISAVPVEDQLYRLTPTVDGMSYPTEDDFRAAVAAVRPEHADEHSLARLRTGWSEEVAGKLADWSERLKSGLTDLSEGWSGTDFEAFEGVCTETRELVDGIVEDIDSTVASLQSTEEAIYSLQGGDSGEVPYPAPQLWIDGEWHSWVAVHIRPAWWHGDCIEYTCQDAEHVLALGGADPELATEIIDYIDERVEYYVDYYESPVNIERDGLDPKGITLEEAKELAVGDAAEQYGSAVEQNWSDYDSRHADINDDIKQRGGDNDAEQQSVRTTRSDRNYPEVADQGHMNLEAPSMQQPTGYGPPESTQDPSLEPPGGQAEPESPWKEDDGGDEATSGGLASGGSGLGGGGFGGQSPGGAAPPTGSPSVPAGAGLGAATVAAGAAGAAGAGGRGTTAMMGGGAGAPQGMGEDTEREPDVDLVEDENMWGFVNEDDDPYA